jgi:hypothetical protein
MKKFSAIGDEQELCMRWLLVNYQTVLQGRAGQGRGGEREREREDHQQRPVSSNFTASIILKTKDNNHLMQSKSDFTSS